MPWRGRGNVAWCHSNSTDHVIKPEQNQPTSNLPTSRREFLGGAALTVIGLSLPVSVASDFIETKATRLTLGFHDLHRGPDRVMVQTATGDLHLYRAGG